jgi:DNA helicase-2/ATP-dependent DNA helicase PcrA
MDVLAGADVLSVLRGSASEHQTLSSFIDWFDQQAEAESLRRASSDGGKRGDEVLVQTIHKVKGEEFRCVALYHVDENVLPHRQAIESQSESAIEEERRVCYVGVTRAIDGVLVTGTKGQRSRFIDELDHPRLSSVKRGARGVKRAPPVGSHTASISCSQSLLGSILEYLARLFSS